MRGLGTEAGEYLIRVSGLPKVVLSTVERIRLASSSFPVNNGECGPSYLIKSCQRDSK